MFYSKFLFLVVSASLLNTVSAGPIQARSMTADQVITNIKALTTKSEALSAPARVISILDPALLLIGKGNIHDVADGLQVITTLITKEISQGKGTMKFTVEQQETDIITVLTSFVAVHQKLLNILIGKAGILNGFGPFGPAALIRSTLVSLESVLDTFLLNLVDMFQDSNKADAANEQKIKLDKTLTLAIDAYI